MNLGAAFQGLWKGRSKYPTFHKKGRNRDSFYVQNSHGRIFSDGLQIPKVGHVRLAENLRFEGKVMSYTVSTYAGKWYVSVAVELPDSNLPCANPDSVVGIDVGLKHIAVASDGTTCDQPSSIKPLEERLKRAQKALSRSQRNSHNRAKRLLRKQKIQAKIDNIRQDVAHKFTTAIAKNHGVVVTEDLHIQEMKDKAQWKALRRSFQSSCMSQILWQLSYKALHYRKAPRFFASSKTCSHCGHVKAELGLNERVYTCAHCGAVLDRDFNAACNLMKSGLVKPDAPVDKPNVKLG